MQSRIAEALDDGFAAELQAKRLAEELNAEAARSAARAETVTELLSRLDLRDRRVEEREAAAARHAAFKRQVERRVADSEAANVQLNLELARANAGDTDFWPWRTRRLADTMGLGKLCRQLTTFRSLTAYRKYFDIALDGQGSTRPGRRGVSTRMDY